MPGPRSARRRRRRPELQRRPGGDARDARADGARCAHVKLAAQPNAGKPREIEGRNLYLCSPEYMASYARRFINTGVRLVGGCCGTTPEHIRAIKAWRSARWRPARRRRRTAPAPRRRRRAPRAWPPVAREQKSRMANTLAARRLRGQRGADAAARLSTPTRSSSRRATLKIRGVDLVNIPDSPRASARMSALAAAFLIQQQAGRRDDPPLRLPRSQPARHAVGPARRARDGRPQRAAASPAIRRRSATIRTRRRCSTSTRSG